MTISTYVEIASEVKQALLHKQPVVALESTIISHGMPYPQNLETAQQVETIVRDNGAVPATIGILGGVLKVGLNGDELEYMAQSSHIVKASRRDLPFLIAKRYDGATTVATTMLIASLAGIEIMATGGTGGVHRGAQNTFDISADLMELSRTNVAVVCAGVKSILDIGLTLEYLETHGVPVVSFGVDDFPAFYTRESGFLADYRVDTVEELASALKAKWDLKLHGGLVIGNPIPAEFAMDQQKINQAITEALEEMEAKGIVGKETTPYLLSKIVEITEGKSLESNIQLVYNNAKLASQLATAYYRSSFSPKSTNSP